MGEPATQAEKNVFGAGVELHPASNLPLENGRGALSPDQQLRNVHIPLIERTQGKEAADVVRHAAGIPTAEELAAQAKAEAEKKAADEKAKFDAAVDKRAKELLAEAEASKQKASIQ